MLESMLVMSTKSLALAGVLSRPKAGHAPMRSANPSSAHLNNRGIITEWGRERPRSVVRDRRRRGCFGQAMQKQPSAVFRNIEAQLHVIAVDVHRGRLSVKEKFG